MEDERGLILLIQQYAAKFGITFSSSLMENEQLKPRLAQLMMQAINGERGAVTDEDVTHG